MIRKICLIIPQVVARTFGIELTTSLTKSFTVFAQLFVRRYQGRGQPGDVESPTHTKWGTGKRMRRPWLERWGEAMGCHSWGGQLRVAGSIQRWGFVATYIHWELGVMGNCYSNSHRELRRVFKLPGKTCRNLGGKEASQWFESVTGWKQ